MYFSRNHDFEVGVVAAVAVTAAVAAIAAAVATIITAITATNLCNRVNMCLLKMSPAFSPPYINKIYSIVLRCPSF